MTRSNDPSSPTGYDVLVIDDQRASLHSISRAIARRGYQVARAADVAEARRQFEDHRPPVVVTDLNLPDGTGLDIVREFRQRAPLTELIIITAFASVETAVEAMKQGALDYVTKPVDLDQLRALVDRAWARASANLRQQGDTAREDRWNQIHILGQSTAMHQLRERIHTVAGTRASVLITGESGTGKELVARGIHETSDRAEGPFVAVNCAAFPEGLLEAELFGHEKGAFTGAHKRVAGKFESANRGTIFLDEVGEITPGVQTKLLRVLENREIMRLGSSNAISVDVRILAATNADLEQAVTQGAFREDLYYRLKVVSIEVPPLRERREDIPMLAQHFMAEFGRENNRHIESISEQALAVLAQQPWKGNVRELRNCLENMVIFGSGSTLDIDNIPAEYRQTSSGAAQSTDSGEPDPLSGKTMEEIERQAILHALEQNQQNKTHAARALGIGLRTLQRKIKQFGLED